MPPMPHSPESASKRADDSSVGTESIGSENQGVSRAWPALLSTVLAAAGCSSEGELKAPSQPIFNPPPVNAELIPGAESKDSSTSVVENQELSQGEEEPIVSISTPPDPQIDGLSPELSKSVHELFRELDRERVSRLKACLSELGTLDFSLAEESMAEGAISSFEDLSDLVINWIENLDREIDDARATALLSPLRGKALAEVVNLAAPGEVISAAIDWVETVNSKYPVGSRYHISSEEAFHYVEPYLLSQRNERLAELNSRAEPPVTPAEETKVVMSWISDVNERFGSESPYYIDDARAGKYVQERFDIEIQLTMARLTPNPDPLESTQEATEAIVEWIEDWNDRFSGHSSFEIDDPSAKNLVSTLLKKELRAHLESVEATALSRNPSPSEVQKVLLEWVSESNEYFGANSLYVIDDQLASEMLKEISTQLLVDDLRSTLLELDSEERAEPISPNLFTSRFRDWVKSNHERFPVEHPYRFSDELGLSMLEWMATIGPQFAGNPAACETAVTLYGERSDFPDWPRELYTPGLEGRVWFTIGSEERRGQALDYFMVKARVSEVGDAPEPIYHGMSISELYKVVPDGTGDFHTFQFIDDVVCKLPLFHVPGERDFGTGATYLKSFENSDTYFVETELLIFKDGPLVQVKMPRYFRVPDAAMGIFENLNQQMEPFLEYSHVLADLYDQLSVRRGAIPQFEEQENTQITNELIQPGEEPPAIELVGGAEHSLEQNGKPKVLLWWAHWCGPCIREETLAKKDQLIQFFGDDVDFIFLSPFEKDGADQVLFTKFNARFGADAPVLRVTNFSDWNVLFPSTIVLEQGQNGSGPFVISHIGSDASKLGFQLDDLAIRAAIQRAESSSSDEK